MFVTKRGGQKEAFNSQKLVAHIRKLCFGLSEDEVDIYSIVHEISTSAHNGITTKEIEALAANIAASKKTLHSDYGILAGRLRVTSLHANTVKRFSTFVTELYGNGENPLISPEFVVDNADALDSAVLHARDFNFNVDDFEALSQHLLRVNGIVVERPQHMFMRAAIDMHGENIDSVVETYDNLSRTYSKAQSAPYFQTGSWWATSPMR